MIQLLSAAVAATALMGAPAPYDAVAWRADFAQMQT